MRGITIINDNNSIHTGDDLDLVQEAKDIGAPKIQSYLVDVPGRNGLLNLTKGLTGDVTYQNRSLKFRYLATGRREDLLEIIDLFNGYHGETVKIIDDDTPDYYYEGEVSVTTTWNNTLLTISLDVNADPFRQNLDLTEIPITLSDTSKDLIITNQGVRVIPTVEVSKEATIMIDTNIYNLKTGTYTLDALELKTGSNLMSVSGSGTLTVRYREARI